MIDGCLNIMKLTLVTIATQPDPTEIRAWTDNKFPGLAIHRRVDEGKVVENAGWNVTHIQSGRIVASNFALRKHGVAYALKASKIVNFDMDINAVRSQINDARESFNWPGIAYSLRNLLLD
jgi:hypothetical protein